MYSLNIIMATIRIAWRLSTVPSDYVSSRSLWKQTCTFESISRQYRTLSRTSPSMSRSLSCSPASSASSRMRSIRHTILPLDTAYGPRKIQHRSSSTNGGSGKSTDVKTTQSDPTQTTTSNNGSTGRLSESNDSMTFWQKFLAPKPMPERYSATWWREIVLICTVFAITGSTTMLIVRPAVSEGLGIKGNFIDGPWSYRICSIVIMTPIYATLLVGIGTIFGRHAYFRHFSVKIFSRFGIPPALMDPTYEATKQSFKKW